MQDPKCACTRIRSCGICQKKELYEPTYIDSTSVSDVPGLYILNDFVTASEERLLVDYFDGHAIGCNGHDPESVPTVDRHDVCRTESASRWIDSQSGRRKQDYGPKINFLKRRIKIDASCRPVPFFLRNFLKKVKTLPLGTCDSPYHEEIRAEMEGFYAIEMVALDYQPERRAHIEPHFDDVWAWGPRIVGLNLLSDSDMLFIREDTNGGKDRIVKIHVPARSIYIMSKESRYQWKHAIAASMIESRRISFTFRELSEEVIHDQPEIAQKIFEMNQIHHATPK